MRKVDTMWLLLLELITCNCFVAYNDGGCGVQCIILHSRIPTSDKNLSLISHSSYHLSVCF